MTIPKREGGGPTRSVLRKAAKRRAVRNPDSSGQGLTAFRGPSKTVQRITGIGRRDKQQSRTPASGGAPRDVSPSQQGYGTHKVSPVDLLPPRARRDQQRFVAEVKKDAEREQDVKRGIK